MLRGLKAWLVSHDQTVPAVPVDLVDPLGDPGPAASDHRHAPTQRRGEGGAVLFPSRIILSVITGLVASQLLSAPCPRLSRFPGSRQLLALELRL